MSEQQQTPSAAAPGWYPDPVMAGTQRYWDGGQWTGHAAPAQPQAPERNDEGLIAGGLITAVLLPIVGFVIGIVLLTRDNTKWGLSILLGSIGMGLLWFWMIQPSGQTYY